MREEGQDFRQFLLLIFVALLFLFLDSRGVLPGREIFQSMTIPVKSALTQVKNSFSSPFNFFGRGISDGKKISQLEEKVASLSAQLVNQSAKDEEIAALRRLLGAPLSPSWKFTPARVVAKTDDALTVVGATDIAPGTTAILPQASGGIYVGRVQEVLGAEIKIILPNNPAAKIPAYGRSSGGSISARGIVVGKQSEAIFDQVLTSENLEKGFLVATSGEGGPPDLLIGEVAEVKLAAGQAWKQAKIKLAIPEKLDYVFFVTKY